MFIKWKLVTHPIAIEYIIAFLVTTYIDPYEPPPPFWVPSTYRSGYFAPLKH